MQVLHHDEVDDVGARVPGHIGDLPADAHPVLPRDRRAASDRHSWAVSIPPILPQTGRVRTPSGVDAPRTAAWGARASARDG
ncbi:hypothetical protein EV383_5407 [Pseudonocardia sediminis]|uniref:Uncharacterized protein n=1 Tax=Pseudonocardia sediminis TaxID=1397368 RepID=A0A4Q7V2X5_PSEST|nr:hypothetical protein EV383_5407 [Pseudonocardia sediminis]